MQLGRYFLREQPSGTWIDYIEPWPKNVNSKDVVTQSMDQCMSGCRAADGTPVKQPTEWTANHELLVKPMRKFVCDGSHEHAHPTGKELERLKLHFGHCAAQQYKASKILSNTSANYAPARKTITT